MTIAIATASGAQILMNEIHKRGITRVFGVPGRENASILFNEVPEVEFITGRLEMNAGIMADITGRITRTPQACFCTMGPGATNMATAVASSKLNFSPTVYIMAQLESDDRFYNVSHQCVDNAGIFEPLAKWSVEIDSAEQIASVINRAFDIALMEPVGPVVVSIPVDLFKKQVAYEESQEVERRPENYFDELELSDHSMNEFREALLKAKHPVCIVGQEAIRAQVENEVKEFCESWSIPIVLSANAKGIIPENHPLNYGAVSPYMEGILKEDGVLDLIFCDVDYVICIGYQYVDDILPKMWQRGCPKKVIHISSFDCEEIVSKYNPDLKVIGQIKQILPKAGVSLAEKKSHPNVKRIQQIYKAAYERKGQIQGKLSPIEVVKCVNENLEDGFFLTDIGFYRHHAIMFSNPATSNRFFTDAGLSSFGTGLGSVAGAQFLDKTKRAFMICGDGGFHSTSCDLATLSKHNLPAVIIVMNNDAFKLIHLYQKRHNVKDNSKVITLSRVDFVKLAEANGVIGKKVRSVEELNKAIKDHDRLSPLLIECEMEYDDEFFESF